MTWCSAARLVVIRRGGATTLILPALEFCFSVSVYLRNYLVAGDVRRSLIGCGENLVRVGIPGPMHLSNVDLGEVEKLLSLNPMGRR